jgi:hypothetical protein
MSHARKHVIRSVRDELVEPDPKRNQSIVRVAETRGQNLYLAEKPVCECYSVETVENFKVEPVN